MDNRYCLYHYGVKGMKWDQSKRKNKPTNQINETVRLQDPNSSKTSKDGATKKKNSKAVKNWFEKMFPNGKRNRLNKYSNVSPSGIRYGYRSVNGYNPTLKRGSKKKK